MTQRRTCIFALMMLALLASTRAWTATDRPIRSQVATIHSGPGAPDVVFIVAGDSRPTMTGAPMPRVARAVAGEIGLIQPDFVLWTGDTVYGYGDTIEELRGEYAAFLGLFGSAQVPIFNSPGNHEIHSDDAAPCDPRAQAPEEEFEKRFGHLYGSFDFADIHVIALDTAVRCYEDLIDGEQLAWLKADLEANKRARMIFVFTHTELFSSPLIDDTQKAGHPPVANRDDLHAIFGQYPVRAVFSGHEHLYWREAHDGIDYFVVGGGGAPVYAPPERQGFSHYLLVTVSGSTVTYDLIEPGRLFLEEAAAGGHGDVRAWIVNSNDADITLRGARVKVPGAPGDCADLQPEAHVTSWDRTTAPVDVRKTGCTSERGSLDVTLSLKAPKGRSVAVSIKRPAAPKR